MASIIKADTLQSTTSNVFVLNSAGTEYARFDSSGVFQLANPTTFPAGTEALPSITATGDTNTGLYFPAADTIAFATAGTEDMRIDSSGNVMIGTTTSQVGAKLSVTGGIQGTITSGTANTTLSGTSINFTSIPSWVKRITVMFSGVSTSGTANIIVQLGTGATPTYTTSGYLGTNTSQTGTAELFTSGFTVVSSQVAASLWHGSIVIANITSNTWAESAILGNSNAAGTRESGGSIPLGAVLTAVRITTSNGTDTFDAGSINILYEG